jgi:hypothetical protein
MTGEGSFNRDPRFVTLHRLVGYFSERYAARKFSSILDALGTAAIPCLREGQQERRLMKSVATKNRVRLAQFLMTFFCLMVSVIEVGVGSESRGSAEARFSFAATPTPSTRPRTVTPGNVPMPDLGPGASLHGQRLFPPDNPWNQDISNSPVDPNSANLIKSIGVDAVLHPDFGTVWNGAPNGIPYIVVAGTQLLVPVSFRSFGGESDPGPYPVPRNAPIEGGPNSTGDRHVLVIDRDRWKLYEMFSAAPANNGAGWIAGSGAVFDLNSNTLRPEGWTSADAAGLPIFPGLVRYDEVFEQREIKHALRFTVGRSRRAYVYPARHFASGDTDPNLPPMGMRVRLKASFDIFSYSPANQVILRALKKYGMFVADNGPGWFLSGAPNPRWSNDDLGMLKTIKGSNFEVVRMGTIVTR